jgi:hypothetical protein
MRAHGGKLRLRRLPAHLHLFVCMYIGERPPLKIHNTQISQPRQTGRYIYWTICAYLGEKLKCMHYCRGASRTRKREDYFSRAICGVTSRTVNFKCKYVASKLMRPSEEPDDIWLFSTCAFLPLFLREIGCRWCYL